MAKQWDILKLPLSTDSDNEKIVAELNSRQTDDWELYFCEIQEGNMVFLFRKDV